MNEVHWVVEDDLAVENKQSFKDVCENFHVVEYIPFTCDETSRVKGFPTDSKECVIAYGCVETIQKIKRLYPSWQPNSYANYDAFDTTKYYEYYYDYLLNKDYVISSYKEIMDDFNFWFDEFGTEDLFMRPTKGSKTFTGKAFPKNEDGYNALKNEKDCYNISDDEMILIAPAINLKREWRLVVVGHDVINGCLYKENFRHKEEEGFPAKVLGFANKIINEVGYKYWFDSAYVMDICETKTDDLRLIECNAFSSAGMYSMDLKPIVEAVEDAAWIDWDDHYGGKN